MIWWVYGGYTVYDGIIMVKNPTNEFGYFHCMVLENGLIIHRFMSEYHITHPTHRLDTWYNSMVNDPNFCGKLQR